jgi:hypothetical protein
VTRARWPRPAAAAVGLGWFLQIGGGPTLDPRNVAWLLAGDWRQHWLGWLFFREEPWAFPLGRIGSLLYPVGTNVGFTDSNPLVSVLLKPFSPLLPTYVQFIGPWLALCFALQGYAGAALAATVTRRPWQQFLGGCLFALSPALAARLGHDTLCAHWLILALLCLGLRECPDAGEARRMSWLAVGIAALSAAIHPYLAVMCGTLALAVYTRLWVARQLPLVRAGMSALGTATAMLAVLGAIGYFDGAHLGSRGFGVYSANLLTLVAPMGHSRLLPSVAVPPHQWEGFGFLGAGGLVLAVVAVAVSVRRRPGPGRHVWPVVAVSVLMAAYAVSTVVFLGERELLRAEWLAPLLTPFRSSGRFIWPFHYLWLVFGVWGATRAAGRGRPALGTAVLAIAVGLQAFDTTVSPSDLAAKPFRPAPIPAARLAVGHFRHVALVPMQVLGVCGAEYDEDRAYRYMYLAYQLRATFNGGIYARLPRERVLAECRQLDERVQQGALDRETIYVVAPGTAPAFARAGAACARFEGDWVCVSADSDAGFRDELLALGARARDR